MRGEGVSGSIHVFRLLGIDVYLHYLWFGLLLIQVGFDREVYAGPMVQARLWQLAELVTAFAIVLMHEYGHALACRSVGGRADEIVLWPMGGIAFVEPPERPGPVLWSLVAGPLVNLVLAPAILLIYLVLTDWQGELLVSANTAAYLKSVLYINTGLLLFNILPIYPLDGGQIVGALLWFKLGHGRALRIAAGLSLGLGGLLAAVALWWRNPWMLVMSGFILWQATRGVSHAKELIAEEKAIAEEQAAAAASLSDPGAVAEQST